MNPFRIALWKMLNPFRFMWSNDVNAVFDWGGVQAGIYILAITSPPPLEGDIWWPNTLGLSFSNRFSHVEMKKCKNFEKKNDSRGPTSTLNLRFWPFFCNF